jgi:hypothetical protein
MDIRDYHNGEKYKYTDSMIEDEEEEDDSDYNQSNDDWLIELCIR